MGRNAAERVTSPAVGVAVIVAAAVIAIRPDLSLIVLAIAEAIAGIGCATTVRISLKHKPPSTTSALLLAILAMFWWTMAGLSLWWFTPAR